MRYKAMDAPANEDVGLRYANPTYAWARTTESFHDEIMAKYAVIQTKAGRAEL